MRRTEGSFGGSLGLLLVASAACGTGSARPSVDLATAGASGSSSSSGGASGTQGVVVGAAGAGGPAGASGAAGASSAGGAGTSLTEPGDASPPPDGTTSDTAPADAPGALGAPPGSPVALSGTLHAQGNRIVGAQGKPVELKGMSLYWSQLPAGSAFYNADVVNWLVKDWHISIIRIAIAVTGKNDGDYLSQPDAQLKLLDTVVEAGVANGIYTLIDWHDSTANQHLDAAKTFFDTVSKKYGGNANTIYEIWNEPLGNTGLTWTGDLKPYAETISKVIRPNDPSNLMVVGTPFWDQQPASVIGNEVADVNVAYTLHFYAGYQPHYFEGAVGMNAQMAVAGGIPLFVTEWGTTDPLTQTMFNEAETRTWMAFLDQNFISSCNWSISGANEGSSALKQGASATGGWPDSALSQSGLLVRSLIRGN
jgi:endoglucanase